MAGAEALLAGLHHIVDATEGCRRRRRRWCDAWHGLRVLHARAAAGRRARVFRWRAPQLGDAVGVEWTRMKRAPHPNPALVALGDVRVEIAGKVLANLREEVEVKRTVVDQPRVFRTTRRPKEIARPRPARRQLVGYSMPSETSPRRREAPRVRLKFGKVGG